LRFGLKEETIGQICAVLQKFPQVSRATVYGSRAKGNFKTGSDIDLTLHGAADLDLPVLLKIMDEIDDLLLPYSCDLSIFSQINDLEVIDHISRVGQTFYEKPQ